MKARIKLAVSIAAFAALLAPTVSAGQEIDLVVARDVVDRQPVGESSSFPSDVGELVAWTDITDSPDGAITYTWRHENGLTAITVRISRAPRWRTWSRKAIPDGWTGEWTVEAAMGEAVARVSFTIEPE
jgi:hypothetical protein